MIQSSNIRVMSSALLKIAKILRRDFSELEKIQNSKQNVEKFVFKSIENIKESLKFDLTKARPEAELYFVEDEAKIDPLIRGGMQEMGYRAGTENFILIAAFSKAITHANKLISDGVWEKVRELRDYLEIEIQNIASETKIAGMETERLPNTSCFVTPDWKGESQVIGLDLMGFSVSSGSACTSGKISASDTLVAMGFDEEIAKNGLRVSLGPNTKKSNIESFISAWKRLYIKHKKNN